MRPFMYEESDWMLVNDDLHVERQTAFRLECITCSNVYMMWPNARTLRMKSGGVPGLTVGLRTPSW